MRSFGWPKKTVHAKMAGTLAAALLLTGCGASAPGPTDTLRQEQSQEPDTAQSDAKATVRANATQSLGPEEGTVQPDAATAAGAAGRIQDPSAGRPEDAPGDYSPVNVRIPSIDVDAPLETLSIDDTGTLLPPVAWDAAGWYDRSPLPGERGPSVIAGHLTAPEGPAVFIDLGKLVPGDRVEVDQSDGTTAVFEVNRTISAERTDSFPTEEIYGPTPDAQLRLITCDGEYDPERGHWTRNMVVFATLVTA